jgi:alpha-mannosidase
MTDYDGMRDAGLHRFEYSIAAYDKPFAQSNVVGDAHVYNAGLLAVAGELRLPPAPQVESDHVRLAALKWAEKGRALIVRCFESRGRSGEAEVTVPPGFHTASKVNLLERQAVALPIVRGRVRVPVHGWEIATLRLE